jgi:hypothetical protein
MAHRDYYEVLVDGKKKTGEMVGKRRDATYNDILVKFSDRSLRWVHFKDAKLLCILAFKDLPLQKVFRFLNEEEPFIKIGKRRARQAQVGKDEGEFVGISNVEERKIKGEEMNLKVAILF